MLNEYRNSFYSNEFCHFRQSYNYEKLKQKYIEK